MTVSLEMGAATREAYGTELVALGRENPNIVVLDADLSKSTMTRPFAQEFPERFFDFGVAEQNMIGVAAGLALSGKIPFASTFASFAPGRCFDQLRVAVAQSGANVKVAATHSGLTVGEDGASHQAIEDVALARALVGFVVMVPADEVAAAWAVRAAAAHQGPVYIRLGRAKTPRLYWPGHRFTWGKAEVLAQGRDATVIANGVMVAESLKAANILMERGLSVRVLDLHTVAPLDEVAIVAAARETGAIVTAEEHLLSGGTGSAVAQLVAESCPVPMEFVAIKNRYGQSGKPQELLREYGLTAQDIVAAVEKVIARKRCDNGEGSFHR